jgi:hypothetical protein
MNGTKKIHQVVFTVDNINMNSSYLFDETTHKNCRLQYELNVLHCIMILVFNIIQLFQKSIVYK